jgi:hypothetical protein
LVQIESIIRKLGHDCRFGLLDFDCFSGDLVRFLRIQARREGREYERCLVF